MRRGPYLEVTMLFMVLALAVMQNPTTPTAQTLRYRVEAKTTLDQDLTSIGRGKISGGSNAVAFVTVALTDSADGQVARITVDSMKLEATGAMAAQMPAAAAAAAADSARGAWVHAYTVRNTLRGVPQPSVQNPALAPIMQIVGVMFPGIRSGIKAGDSWADTTKVDGDIQSGHQVGAIIAVWQSGALEDGAFVLNGTSSSNVRTTGQAGQVVTVVGSSTERLVIGIGGPAKSGYVESSVNSSIVQRPGDTPIPQHSTAVLRLTRLP